jgi:hypothetical protein
VRFELFSPLLDFRRRQVGVEDGGVFDDAVSVLRC